MSSYELFPQYVIHDDRELARQPRLVVATCTRAVQMAAVAMALGLAGCSADVTRFDFPGFNASESGSGTAPLPSRPIGGVGAGGLATPAEAPSGQSVYTPPRAQRPSDVRVSSLPEPVSGGSAQLAPPQSEPRRQIALAPPSAVPAPMAVAPVARGEQIEVQQGDTLYALSKRHKVSIAELMTVNDLKSPNLKPGQKLHLPAGKHAAAAPQRPALRPEPVVATAPLRPEPVPAAPAAAVDWNGSYTIKAGDSLYAVARQHRVGLNELQSANGITDPRKVRPGTVIKVPGGSTGGGTVIAVTPAVPVTPVSQPVTQAPDAPRVVSAQQPTIINAQDKPERVAAAPTPGVTSDAAAPQVKGTQVAAPAGLPAAGASSGAVPSSKLRWPVKGKIIAGFGPRGDGTHNDGLNLAVPLGADVHAAEAGVVAYAGSELKG